MKHGASVSERLAGTPAAKLVSLLENGPFPKGPPNPLGCRIGLFSGRDLGPYRPLEDGGAVPTGGAYGVVIQPTTDGVLYIIQVDSAGRVAWLFPRNALGGDELSFGKNPVSVGKTIRVPPMERAALVLDDHIGVEHVFVVLTSSGWPELEQALAGTASAPPPSPDYAVLAPLGLRGPSGTVISPESRVTAPSGQEMDREYTTTGTSLVAERWFRHVAAR
jgi:hypothetical protein